MPLSPQEIAELKSQLYSQVSSLPEDRKAQAKKQIDEMSAETLEYLLKQSQGKAKSEKNIFRMIIDKEIESIPVGENKIALAVLDINPISPGHTLIIPKVPVKDSKSIPNGCFTLAKAISKRIVSQLGAKSTELHTENKFNETILNILPQYDSPVHLASPRQKESPENLKKIAQKIKVIKRLRAPKPSKPISLPPRQIIKRRIPQ